MRKNSFTLVGEEISGDWNVQALADIAHAFGGEYAAYVAHSGEEQQSGDANNVALPDADGDLLNGFDWLLAAENGRDAQSIYALKPPGGQHRALIVGNEAKGIRRKTLKRTQAVAEIPLVSHNINCLNVAAAAAIMLYYLSVHEQRGSPLGQAGRTLNAVQKARPDALLIGGRDPMELGSVVRSACAFGWERVFLEDRHNAWYDCDRLMKSEGRGAARRGRNPIKVIPCPDDLLRHYKTIVWVTHEPPAPTAKIPTLHQATLTKRPDAPILIVLPDESANPNDWLHDAHEQHCVTFASLPNLAPAHYHYRQAASIALAEIARQLGRADGNGIYLRGRKQRYQKSVAEDAEATIFEGYDLEDLRVF